MQCLAWMIKNAEQASSLDIPYHWNSMRKGPESVRIFSTEILQPSRLRKDERINIRISTADLIMLKRRAAEQGLPYQTLITSILHKHIMRAAPCDR